MTIVDRLNAAANEAIHRGLAGFGRLILAPLEALNQTAMANALNRDYGFTYDDAVTAAADALADDEADDVVDAEVHCADCNCPTVCGCGREFYTERDSPDSPPMWFHRDDDSPIGVECAHYIARVGEDVTCRCGKRFGDFSSHAKHLVDLERASRSPVRVEDLAAHVTAILNACRKVDQLGVNPADEIAADLLSDYHITRK
ncbi:hypothetical protein SEA_PHAYONCE_39 [Mycobacterium phage Phayonce]|uniref:Uncharacterized protein n=1 Tax=Mycobacterium phage Phayonce TaxID=1647302 RepID=A0A0F6YQ44_9CAUD|nr:hypothetical protein SEA_PHAYONCE_39 [Mycobacterium phage Phayonce]AKF14399.1 hypothetical protein SEA_PHAYONCE_39 [Mycobacterium phage Phayonce]